MSERMIIDDVRNQYAGVAKGSLSNESIAISSVVSAFGYSEDELDQLPLPDNSVECVISNGVINRVPDKLAMFGEFLRVLNPGGRVALSDIALKQELPIEIKQSVEAYVGCISGSILIAEYRCLFEQAGFASVVVTDTGSDLNAYTTASGGGCCGGGSCGSDEKSFHDGLASFMQSFDANAFDH